MKKFAVIFAAVWVGFSLVLTGCGNKKEAETKAVLVKTMVVGETAKAESRKFSGTVHGYFESPLAFQVGGRITRRLVHGGTGPYDGGFQRCIGTGCRCRGRVECSGGAVSSGVIHDGPL